jgi:cytochrome c oxidase cbb3-type subunit IV
MAMTVNDWIGTILTVVIALLMVVLYVYVLTPKNRDRLEAMRNIPFDEDKPDSGERDGRK